MWREKKPNKQTKDQSDWRCWERRRGHKLARFQFFIFFFSIRIVLQQTIADNRFGWEFIIPLMTLKMPMRQQLKRPLANKWEKEKKHRKVSIEQKAINNNKARMKWMEKRGRENKSRRKEIHRMRRRKGRTKECDGEEEVRNCTLKMVIVWCNNIKLKSNSDGGGTVSINTFQKKRQTEYCSTHKQYVCYRQQTIWNKSASLHNISTNI